MTLIQSKKSSLIIQLQIKILSTQNFNINSEKETQKVIKKTENLYLITLLKKHEFV